MKAERKVLLKIEGSVDSSVNALITALIASRSGVDEHLRGLLLKAEAALAEAKREVDFQLAQTNEDS